MKRQLHIFFNALSFFTRVPAPSWVKFSTENKAYSMTYFSLIGILVGAFGALVYAGAIQLLPFSLAVLLSMSATIYLTGAFHEDGFADVCDAFGGAWTKEKILDIMKDSQVGAYGAIGLFLLLILKFFSLYELPQEHIVLLLISGHSVSRLMAAIVVYTLPYVSSQEKSKSKEIMIKKKSLSFLLNIAFGLLPLFFFNDIKVFLVLLPTSIAMLFLRFKFKKWIKGQTGDCAGATQQFCEVVFYLSFLVLWKFM